jgi:hypothetical protein
MRIDQDRPNAGTPEHGGRGRVGQAAPDDRDGGVFHGCIPHETLIIAPGKANKPLASMHVLS